MFRIKKVHFITDVAIATRFLRALRTRAATSAGPPGMAQAGESRSVIPPCYTGDLNSQPRVCAVSFLNTAPLVWGLLHGPQRGAVDLSFRTPSECAAVVERGEVDIGLVPSVELARRRLKMVHGVGIASRGAVRSILLIHRRPVREIRTLAADTSSLTSVALARILLARRFGVEPEFIPAAPDPDSMLEGADAALIIGDPALRVDPESLSHPALDLGREWRELTGLSMVFAVWAGAPEFVNETTGALLRESCRFGLDRMDDIVRTEGPSRGFSEGFTRDYLTRHIVHEFGTAEYEGLNQFLGWASEYAPASPSAPGILSSAHR